MISRENSARPGLEPPSGTKLCPMCAESIKEAAKVCPHCQFNQRGLRFRHQDLVQTVSVAAFICFLAGIGIWAVSRLQLPYGRSFASHRNELLVLRTALEPGPELGQFQLAGFITNTGLYAWRVKELEVRFLDGQDRIVDVADPGLPEGFVVQPHREGAFAVRLGSLATNSRTRLVRVQTATDAERLFSPD